jgi:hypothetical protein
VLRIDPRRRYAVRALDRSDFRMIGSPFKLWPAETEEDGDDLPIDDLYDLDDVPVEVDRLAVGEYHVVGGGAEPLMLIARTR